VSFLDKIFGRRPTSPIDPALASKLVDLISGIIATAKDRDEIRRRIAQAAHAGDLDFLVEGVRSDRQKIDDFIENG
jgi:hypothetical protein